MNSKRKRRGGQLPLPLDHGQDRSPHRESPEFYECVRYLRLCGYPVFRISGTQARFNGRIVTNDRLRKLAAHYGLQSEGKENGAPSGEGISAEL